MRDNAPHALSSVPEELHGSPIHGLGWLFDAPRFHAVAIAEDGYPAPIASMDPRIYALHKAWVSRDENRDPRKKARDLEQAKACAAIASRLGLSFEDVSALSVLPASVRALEPLIVDQGRPPLEEDAEDQSLTPNW